jgi:N-acetylmuramoyl-L-alanine amidase
MVQRTTPKTSKAKQVLSKHELKAVKTNGFKVQFAAGTNIKLNPANFNGLKDVSMTTSNGKLYSMHMALHQTLVLPRRI